METSAFTSRADALLTWAEREDLITVLAMDPRAGALVPGMHGIRKLRFAPEGRGKSGAFRVLYYLLDDNTPNLVLLLYGKNEQSNPTPDQRKRLGRVVDDLKEKARAASERRAGKGE